MKSFSTVEELETFLLKHGESIVDLMGGEIDRIELKLRVSIEYLMKTVCWRLTSTLSSACNCRKNSQKCGIVI